MTSQGPAPGADASADASADAARERADAARERAADPVKPEGETRPHAGGRGVSSEGHPRRCTATARSGTRCRGWAVEGMTVCRMHGGASPQARAAAQRHKAEAEATRLLERIWDPDAAPVTDSVTALMSLAGRLEHAVSVLAAHVESDRAGATAVIWTRLLRELRQTLVSIEALGLEQKRVRIDADAGRELAAVMRVVLDRLRLTEEQRSLALVVVPEEFRRVAERAELPQGRGR